MESTFERYGRTWEIITDPRDKHDWRFKHQVDVPEFSRLMRESQIHLFHEFAACARWNVAQARQALADAVLYPTRRRDAFQYLNEAAHCRNRARCFAQYLPRAVERGTLLDRVA